MGPLFVRWGRWTHMLLLAAATSGLTDCALADARTSADYLIDTWQAEHGLPQSTVTCMTQTRDASLWLGTFNSLKRLDGVCSLVFGAHRSQGLRPRKPKGLPPRRTSQDHRETETTR